MSRRSGYQAPTGVKPVSPQSVSSTQPTLPSLAEPVDQRPAVGRDVLVVTADKIAGQNEHAAKITHVALDGSVNLIMFPPIGDPYSIASVRHEDNAPAGSLCWRWPARS